MTATLTNEALGKTLRQVVQEEVAAALQAHGLGLGSAPGKTVGSDAGNGSNRSLPGVDPYSLVPFAEHVLREAGGGPLHVKVMAERIYELGFQHRWPPKYEDQLLRSLNALASPSQHPERFERVGPRTLKLK